MVLLVTSSVRSLPLRKRFNPRSSLVSINELTDLYIFMKALAILMLAQTVSTIVGDDAGVVVWLVVGEALQHPPYLTHFFCH